MELIDLLATWGVPLVFGAVLLEQAGLPLPAAPVLVSAGALSQLGAFRVEVALLMAFIAGLIADHGWFIVGRRHGRRVLSGVCRISLSPETCVRKTDDLISRYGPAILVGAKFIPGVSALAIPTAAAMGVPYLRFLLFDSLGCALWIGAYVGAGLLFSREVSALLELLNMLGGGAIGALTALLVLYIGWQIARRWRLRRLHQLVRISPREVTALIERDDDLLILDARSRLARLEDPRMLPRSIFLDNRLPAQVLPPDARLKTIVTFCTCPSEASAALVAEELIRSGYARVRILTGGADALALLGASEHTSMRSPGTRAHIATP